MDIRRQLAAVVIAAGASWAAAASADTTLFSNPLSVGLGGDCSFSTTCAAAFARGDEFAAQQFTLAAGATINSADFLEYDLGTTPTDVNWGLIAADGAGGLPGTILWSGTDTLIGASEGSKDGFNISRMSWSTGGVYLDAGVYYLAIQAISPVSSTYLGEGALVGGIAETHDAGVTWTSGYETGPSGEIIQSAAVDLYGVSNGVPEPAAWVVMLIGVGAVGGMLRRRARTVTG
jgi:hypothetical protein